MSDAGKADAGAMGEQDGAREQSIRDEAQEAFKRAGLSLKMEHPEKALETLRPLLERLDVLGVQEPDSDEHAFDFAGPEQAYLYVVTHPGTDAGLLHSTVAPYVDAYGIEAAILYELGRYEESVKAIDKALAWNPSDAGLYLERAMAHEAASEYLLVEKDIEDAYPLITLPLDLARYHAFRADVLVSKGSYDLAAAHYAVYHDFDPDDTYARPDEELHELGHQTGQGHAYADLAAEEARGRLEHAGEKYGPSGEAVAVLQQIVQDALETGDGEAARTAAEHLAGLTRDSRWDDVCKKIDGLADGEEPRS